MSTAVRAPANGSTPDPVGELRFTLEIPDLTIGMFTECTGLGVEFDLKEYREGGENGFVHKLRGALTYPNLILTRGVTHEDALLKWFFRTQQRAERPTVTVSLLGPGAQRVRSWALEGAFPVRWQGPSLNAGSSNVATETLEIAHRGLQS
ncbi:MAG: phage tail protein [Solirubrobacterales bacterium]